jgi:hypothetical protein
MYNNATCLKGAEIFYRLISERLWCLRGAGHTSALKLAEKPAAKEKISENFGKNTLR